MKPKPDTCRTCDFWTVHHFDKGRLVTRVGEGWVDSQGTPQVGITFIGEAAGGKEEMVGLPFRSDAQAGSMLERVFRRIGIRREQVAIGNLLQCRPPNNLLSGMKYERSVISNCAIHRDNFIQASRRAIGPNIKTHVTVALGDTAFATLTGLSGDKLTISRARGYPVMTAAYGLVMGTYHPAYVARKRKFFGVLLEDVVKALDWAKDGFAEFPRRYTTHPSRSDVEAFVRQVLAQPSQCLAWDIETDPTIRLDVHRGVFPTLNSLQFSAGPGEGIFLTANDTNWEAIHALLTSGNPKIGHNVWDFDQPIVASQGHILGGTSHDSLWMFHHYQPDITIEDASGNIDQDEDLRLSTSAGLQYVASFAGMDFLWKHLNNSNPEFYGIADVDADSRIWGTKTKFVQTGELLTLPDKMRRMGIWDGYERHVRMMKPILDGAAGRGLWFDLDGRDKLHKELHTITVELDGKLQGHHPDALKRLEPTNGYAHAPRESDKIQQTANGIWHWLDDSHVDEASEAGDDVDDLVAETAVTGVWRPMVRLPFRVEKKELVKVCSCGVTIFAVVKLKKDGTPAAKQPKPQVTFAANCELCRGTGKYYTRTTVMEERWARRLPFKPSQKQLITYIKHRGHKVPHDRKTDKDTTTADKIEELAHTTKDPLYQTTLDIRTVTKMDSTYVTGRWVPTKAWIEYYAEAKRNVGLIQTSFTTAPATGQKSSRNPNIQNAPKHIRNENLRGLDLPKRFRKLIISPPKHRIVEFDYKSFHALTLGFEAECQDYMRLARMDVHTFMTSMMLFKRKVIPAPINLNVGDNDLLLALKDLRASHYIKVAGSWVKPSTSQVKAYGTLDGKGNVVAYTSVPFTIAQEVRDTQAKPAILGYGFGMQGNKLYETNKDSFRNAIEAQEVLALIDEAFPQLKVYRDNIAQLAHTQHYLVTRFGFARWFWDVFSFKYNPQDPKKWKVSHGSDYEDAIALGPSNDAFGHIDEAMLTLESRGMLTRYNFINTVHDSLIFYLHDDIFDTAMGEIKDIMEAPSLVLTNRVAPTGLSVEVEVAVGRDWGSLEKVA